MLNLPKRCPTCGRKMTEEEAQYACQFCGKRVPK